MFIFRRRSSGRISLPCRNSQLLLTLLTPITLFPRTLYRRLRLISSVLPNSNDNNNNNNNNNSIPFYSSIPRNIDRRSHHHTGSQGMILANSNSNNSSGSCDDAVGATKS